MYRLVINQMLHLIQARDEIEQQCIAVLGEHPDFIKLQQIPGIGPINALTILAEAGDRLVINDDVFDWQDLPASVVVFGPGVIGLELGQALSRLGVRIRMFGVGGAIGTIQDDSIRDCALRCFNAEFPLSTP